MVSENKFRIQNLKYEGFDSNAMRYKSRRGFTYIEMLAVVTLIAICFVPLLQMFTQSMEEVRQYSLMGTAVQLGRQSMEEVKNLRYTEAQLEEQGTVWEPEMKSPPLLMNGQTWRVRRSVVRRTDPLEVHIDVFRSEDLDHSVLNLVTLIEDL